MADAERYGVPACLRTRPSTPERDREIALDMRVLGFLGIGRLAFVPFSLATALLVASCSSSDSGAGASTGGGAASSPALKGTPPGPAATFAPESKTFDVTFRPETKVIDGASALLLDSSQSGETFTYRFKPDAAAVAALAPGDVVVLSGIAYRKVVSVDAQADAVVVVAERTKLPDVIDHGTMAWTQTVDFSKPQTLSKAALSFGEGKYHTLDITTGVSYSGMVGDFSVSVSLTPNMGRLQLTVTASKPVSGGNSIALTAEGYLESFQSQGQMVFDPSGLVNFNAGTNQVRGELKLKAAAVNAGVSQDLLNIPLRIQFPMDVGPVPIMVSVGANINITAALNAAPNTAEAEVVIGFNSTEGVQLNGTSLMATGMVGGSDFDVRGGGGTSPIAAGLTACVEAPRVELAFLGELASIGLTQNNCTSVVYTAEPPCNEVDASIVGRGLGQLGFLGVTLASADVELYSRHARRSVGNCGDPTPDTH